MKTIIFYEEKLLRRNWLFYFFILGVLGYIVGVLIPWNAKQVLWSDVALASSVFSRGISFLNLFQSVIVVFLVCDIQRKRNKAETRETFSIRPVGNGRFFLGEFFGIFLPFLVVDVVFMIVCAMIHIVVPDSPENLWVFLFYFFVRVLPPLIFVSGLSLLVTKLVKLPFVSWFVLIGFLYFSYAFLVSPLYGVLDFRGSLLPDSFSSLVGFIHVEENLMQRGAFLWLGISFLCFAASLVKRLPNIPGRKFYLIVPACLCLMVSLCLGALYVGKYQARLKNRGAFREAILEYGKCPTARVLEHEITYRPLGDKFSATSLMKIQNRRKAEMDKFPLFLNPGLEISKIESDGQRVAFRKNRQVVVVERALACGEIVELKIEYEGSIDEDIYQVKILDEDYFAPVVYSSYHENYGKRAAFVSRGYTLLLPEVMWYPMAVLPGGAAGKELNFTSYVLRVENPGENMTVVSQGEQQMNGGNVVFENVQKLTGLSLCIGEFQKRTVTVDSLTVEFYTGPGNDFYMKHFDKWDVLKEEMPGREKRLAKIFNMCKGMIEENQAEPYPFKFFKMIETPPSFLRGFLSGDNVQPEIVFFEERFATTDHYKPDAIAGEGGVQEGMLYENLPYNLSRMNIDRIFTEFTRGVTSERYRGINLIYNELLDEKMLYRTIRPRVLNHVVEKGLEGCMAEEYGSEQSLAISLKVSQLLGYLTSITTRDSLKQFMQEFSARAHFHEVDFEMFIDDFERCFGQNIRETLDEWYASRVIPWLRIKDLSIKKTEELQVLDFKVGNFSETDGVISIITMGTTESGRDKIEDRRSYLIKAGECKRIVVHEDGRYGLKLTTNFSGNMPKTYSLDGEQVLKYDVVPNEGVTLLEREQFYPPGEIVVDNEDKDFHLIDSIGDRKRLADLFTKENEDIYTNALNPKVNTWGKPILSNGFDWFYGESVLSVFVKRAGTGRCKAEWVAGIPETGKYEIFVYRTYSGSTPSDGKECPELKNYYTIYTPEGEEEVVLKFEKDDTGWIFLGMFTLPVGECRVVLDDRGASFLIGKGHGDSKEYIPCIVADAVKWVKVK